MIYRSEQIQKKWNKFFYKQVLDPENLYERSVFWLERNARSKEKSPIYKRDLRLGQRDTYIFILYFGLSGLEPVSGKRLGKVFRLTDQQIRLRVYRCRCIIYSYEKAHGYLVDKGWNEL